MQPREGQLHLRLHARRPRDQAPRGPPGQVVEQHRLAHPGLAAHHQRPALAGAHIGDEPVKYAALAEPARQPGRGPPGTRMCRHRPDAIHELGRRYP